MTTVVGLTGLKLAPRSLSSNKSWASGDEMAKEASESDDYFGGMRLKVKQPVSYKNHTTVVLLTWYLLPGCQLYMHVRKSNIF